MSLILPPWPVIRWSGTGDSPRVLGFNPWIEDFAAYNFWLRPMGLLASLQALEQCGVNTALMDCLHPTWSDIPWPEGSRHGRGHFPRQALPTPEGLPDMGRTFARYGLAYDAVAGALKQMRPAPDVVLVSCLLTYWYTGAQAAIRLIRKIWPHATVVLGGVYASLCRPHALEHSGADAVLSGPFEDPGNWRQLWDVLGAPAPELPVNAGFDAHLRHYAAPRYAPILGSRGCPFSCAYCASKRLYPGFRQRAFQDVWNDFQLCRGMGVRDFAFFDDALLIRPETWLIPFLEGAARQRPSVRLHAPNAMHARALTPEICSLLRKAGLTQVRLGVETLDFASRLDAKLCAEELDGATAALKEVGFAPEEVAAYVLFGLPGQDAASLERTVLGLRERGIRPLLAYYSPLPGSALFPAAREAAFPLLGDVEAEPLLQNNALWPCVPGGFNWQARGYWHRLASGPLG